MRKKVHHCPLDLSLFSCFLSGTLRPCCSTQELGKKNWKNRHAVALCFLGDVATPPCLRHRKPSRGSAAEMVRFTFYDSPSKWCNRWWKTLLSIVVKKREYFPSAFLQVSIKKALISKASLRKKKKHQD